MGRRRENIEDEKLPLKVYRDKYRYYYKPTPRETIRLGPLDMSMSELWDKYEKEADKQHEVMTFFKLWHLFLDGVYYSELAERTRKDYKKHQKKLLKVFGKLKADTIKPEHIRVYLDKRGVQSKTQANHEVSSMSKVYNWGYERGYVKGNPCQGVSKFSVKARDVYMEDIEYYTIHDEGIILVKIAMEISYLCAARISDVLSMKYSQILESGIYIQQGKTGTKQIKQWNDRLRKAIDIARQTWPPRHNNDYVLKNMDGNRVIHKVFNTHYVNARKAAEQKLGKELKCTFHDIKAKGISDFEGSSKDKQLFSGHKTESQVLVYDRKVKISPTLDQEFKSNSRGEL